MIASALIHIITVCEVYHRIGIWWKKGTHAVGKECVLISQVLPIRWILLHLLMLWETDGKTQDWQQADSDPRTPLYWNYSPCFENFSILTKESNEFKLEIIESLLIARDKSILNKADFPLPLELFWYNSGYHMLFYHIICCPSIHFCVCSCRMFSFQYCVTNFSILSKIECMSI